eukprot:scaffold82006_cov63-Phaeocystis_antarctica.AAC.1
MVHTSTGPRLRPASPQPEIATRQSARTRAISAALCAKTMPWEPFIRTVASPTRAIMYFSCRTDAHAVAGAVTTPAMSAMQESVNRMVQILEPIRWARTKSCMR